MSEFPFKTVPLTVEGLSLKIEYSHTPAIRGGWDEEPQPEENEVRNVLFVDRDDTETDITDAIEHLDAWEQVEHAAFGKPMFWRSKDARIESLKEQLAEEREKVANLLRSRRVVA